MPKFKVVNTCSKQIFTYVYLHPQEVLQMELAARNLKKSCIRSIIGNEARTFYRSLAW